MDPSTVEAIKIFIGSSGLIGFFWFIITMSFKTGKLVKSVEHLGQKIESVDKKVDEGFKKVDEKFKEVDEKFRLMDQKIDQRFKDVDVRFQKLEDNIPIINISLTRMEVRLEERTLRTIDAPKKELS